MNCENEKTSATLLSRLHDHQDQAAWHTFVERYSPNIRGYCVRKRLDANLSEEVTAEVLMTLAQKMPTYQYDPNGSFRAWLKSVIRSRLVDFLRKETKRLDRGVGGTTMQQVIAQCISEESADTCAGELSEELTAAVDHDRMLLDQAVEIVIEKAPQSWRAYELRKLQHLSGPETARKLNMRIPAVHVAVSRTIKMLQKEVARLQTEASRE